MGREIRRVPLDFDWPLEAVWPGYLLWPDMEYSLRHGSIEGKFSDVDMQDKYRGQFEKIIGKECHDLRIDPPNGEGWQVWETVSEGSPITPVFATAEELIDALVAGNGRNRPYSRESATAFVKSGYVPSGMIVNGRMYRDIDSAVLKDRKDPEE